MAPTAHPPKVETFDVPAKTNTDPKGFVRPVEVYRANAPPTPPPNTTV